MSKLEEAIEILKDDEIYITDSFYREFRTTIADKYTKAFKTVLEELNNSIPKQYIQDILKELNNEYIKIEKIFDEPFKKENRDMQDYYTQKEAVGIMQTISWLEGRLEELLEGK